jgi:hypothetical protein
MLLLLENSKVIHWGVIPRRTKNNFKQEDSLIIIFLCHTQKC